MTLRNATLKFLFDLALVVAIIWILMLRPSANSLFSYLFLAAVLAMTVWHGREYSRLYRDFKAAPENAEKLAVWNSKQYSILGATQISMGSFVGIVEFVRWSHSNGRHRPDVFFASVMAVLGLVNLALGRTKSRNRAQTAPEWNLAAGGKPVAVQCR